MIYESHVCIFCLQFEEWEQHYGLLGSYIKTQTTPQIFYLPRAHNKATSKLLESTKAEIAGTHGQQSTHWGGAILIMYYICTWFCKNFL